MREDNEIINPPNDSEIDSLLLKSIVETAVDAIVVITADGQICLANPATEKLFGYQATELIGRNVSVLMPEPHRSRHDGYLHNYLKTGEHKIIGIGRDVEGLCKDGSTFPMYLSVAEVQYGEQPYFTGIIHDLSEQKAIEGALRKSEQHLRDVTEAASDWTWEMDRRFRFTFVSERFYSLTGVAQEKVVGQTRWELAGEGLESDIWRRHFYDLEHHRPFRDFVYRPCFGGTPGRYFHFKVSGKPVFDNAGQFQGYRGTGSDVTEHILAKRALRESRRSLETLVSNVPGMVYRCQNSHERSMEFVSEGGKDLTGYRPAELVGGAVTFESLIHPEDREKVWHEVQTALSAHLPFDLTYRISTATGEEKWLWEHGCEIFDEDGRVTALEGLILDISERMQTEQALRALATSTALQGGQDFVASCTRELARTYGAEYAFVGVYTDSKQASIKTLAIWMDEAFRENFTYQLEGTPSQDILRSGMQIVPNKATLRYPQDLFLREFGVESYFGAPLVDSVGKTVGLVSVLDSRPMQPNIWTHPILGIFANRIALELERQQAEDRLRQSEAYMRLTLENAPIGIVSAGLDGQLLDANPAFTGLLGYSHDELMDMTIDDITHAEDRRETRRHFEALVGGDITRYELAKRYLHKDGSVLHVRTQAGLVRDAEGRPVRVVGEVEDETERLKSAQEIQQMRAYLKNIIDSMPSVLVGVDTDGRVTQWNRSAEQSTGITPDEAIGKDLLDLFPQLEGQIANISEAIRRQQPIHNERLPMKRHGETRYAEVMIYPLLSDGAMGAVIRIDDITERIRIEQMMVQTEKMLSVGGLAAGMAHEINNPLSIIMQSAQNILRRVSNELPANQAKAEELGLDLSVLHRYLEARNIDGFIEGILEAASRASRIVADMLAFSRRSTSECLPNRLDEMLETVLRLADSDYDLKKNFDFRQIEVVREYDADLGGVRCDRPQIEQVFLNLIKNAAHAMSMAQPPLPRRIILRTRRETDFAVIEVEDNGPGMDEATRKHAFEPFFTTKEVGVGTGLGLSVSYFIITEQHKGSITVSSHAGKGSRFTIRLPITEMEAV
ncbi:MAG: PAS domain S-box protein [Pseudomonadota bacterium]